MYAFIWLSLLIFRYLSICLNIFFASIFLFFIAQIIIIIRIRIRIRIRIFILTENCPKLLNVISSEKGFHWKDLE